MNTVNNKIPSQWLFPKKETTIISPPLEKKKKKKEDNFRGPDKSCVPQSTLTLFINSSSNFVYYFCASSKFLSLSLSFSPTL